MRIKLKSEKHKIIRYRTKRYRTKRKIRTTKKLKKNKRKD